MPNSPTEQQEQFFHWFAQMGIHRFDLQLRQKLVHPQMDRGAWRWLRPSLDISAGAYFLKYASWTRHMNSQESDVYIRPHGEVKHGVIFLDDLPLDQALKVSKKYASCVVCTSENNTQVWLATDRPLSKIERKAAQSWMRSIGYTDPGSVSGDHLGRLCGFRSQKRGCWVNLTTTTLGDRYSPNIESPLSSPMGEACVSSSPLPKMQDAEKQKSPSEREFGWAFGALKYGVPLDNVIKHLTSLARGRGKRQPDHYAKRTALGAYRLLHPGS